MGMIPSPSIWRDQNEIRGVSLGTEREAHARLVSDEDVGS
jgi:hypothetical protein